MGFGEWRSVRWMWVGRTPVAHWNRLRIMPSAGARWLYTIGRILRQRPRQTMSETKTWMCLICGWIYDEAAGDPEHGIAAGTPWGQVPMNWTCPECGARKEDFEMVQI